jgi:hypothetical protein
MRKQSPEYLVAQVASPPIFLVRLSFMAAAAAAACHQIKPRLVRVSLGKTVEPAEVEPELLSNRATARTPGPIRARLVAIRRSQHFASVTQVI